MIKFYDHYYIANGIPTEYFMDAQSEPEIVSHIDNNLIIKILCWEEDVSEINGIKDADYFLQITFTNVKGFQVFFYMVQYDSIWSESIDFKG